ncbi:hypothetical protein FB446DRAFT_776124 [Lentinula raphanica]|nr:hypothetical protein FB446DRAFT_776124 [Lentinula raphanica]
MATIPVPTSSAISQTLDPSNTHLTRRTLSYDGFPASTHLTFLGGLTAVILPITLVPYLFARRRLVSLQRQFNELESTTKSLQRELQATSVAVTRAQMTADVERRKMRASAHELREEIIDGQREIGTLMTKMRWIEERESQKDEERRAVKSELQYLLEDAKVTRIQGDAIRSMGLSLADIAAFMHEVELWMPQVEGANLTSNDKSRVEQLRLAALMLQNLPRQRPEPKKQSCNSGASD